MYTIPFTLVNVTNLVVLCAMLLVINCNHFLFVDGVSACDNEHADFIKIHSVLVGVPSLPVREWPVNKMAMQALINFMH